MIDIHSHILSGIDDGASSLEESVNILKNLKTIGFTHVFLTPHYIHDSKYISDNYQKQDYLENLKKILKEQNIDIYLYLGNEVFIDKDILSFIKDNKITTLNGSRYLLVEFPFSRMPNDLMDTLFLIRSKGFIPVIAHPERYLYFQSNHDKIKDFLKMGCMFQGNYLSISGKYGHNAKKLFIKMLKNNEIHFLATDVHQSNDIIFKKMPKIKKDIIKIIGEDNFNILSYENPLKVLKNEKINIEM